MLGVIVRFVCSRGFIHHRCVALPIFNNRSLGGDELSREIIKILTTKSGVWVERWQYVICDGRSVNRYVQSKLGAISMGKLRGLDCWSSVLDESTKEFTAHCYSANQFLLWWDQLIKCSPSARITFAQEAGKQAVLLSYKKWPSIYSLFKQIYRHLSVVKRIAHSKCEVAESITSDALKAHLREVFGDIATLRTVKLELAAIVENAYIFAQMCSVLERDGFVAPMVYDQVMAIQAAHDKLSNEVLTRREWSPMLWTAVLDEHPDQTQRAPAFDAIRQRFLPAFRLSLAQIGTQGRLHSTWIIFRGCRMLNYRFVRNKEVLTLAAECNFLLRLPVVTEAVLEGLRAELDEYHARTLEHEQNGDLWAFWRQNKLKLPQWYALARNVALVMTSTSCLQRLFNLYGSQYNEQQQRGAVEDYKEATIMMHFNKLQRRVYL